MLNISFVLGSKTDKYFTNITGATALNVGRREQAAPQYLNGTVWGLKISDVIDLQMSEGGTFLNKINLNRHDVTGSYNKGFQDYLGMKKSLILLAMVLIFGLIYGYFYTSNSDEFGFSKDNHIHHHLGMNESKKHHDNF